MNRLACSTFALVLLLGCAGSPREPDTARKAAAERFIQGIYSGDESLIEELAAADIVVSYPAFTIRGHEALRDLSRRFAGRCPDLRTTVHETIAEGEQVVLIWSAQGRCAGPDGSDSEAEEDLSMGGITVYQFDTNGKIVRELGEDSLPGPYGRLSG